MTTQHTPGPWLYTQEGVDAFGIVKPDGYSIVHLAALHNSTSASELPANARLIAAAPDLLDALRGLIRDIGVSAVYQDHPAYNAARAAIAKATGEQ
jgi:hypothetical protein